jgi:hypothetical protein
MIRCLSRISDPDYFIPVHGPDPVFRDHKSNGSWIPDPDPQHWLWSFIFRYMYSSVSISIELWKSVFLEIKLVTSPAGTCSYFHDSLLFCCSISLKWLLLLLSVPYFLAFVVSSLSRNRISDQNVLIFVGDQYQSFSVSLVSLLCSKVFLVVDLMFSSSVVSSMFFDEDWDLAHEFYEEVAPRWNLIKIAKYFLWS